MSKSNNSKQQEQQKQQNKQRQGETIQDKKLDGVDRPST